MLGLIPGFIVALLFYLLAKSANKNSPAGWAALAFVVNIICNVLAALIVAGIFDAYYKVWVTDRMFFPMWISIHLILLIIVLTLLYLKFLRQEPVLPSKPLSQTLFSFRGRVSQVTFCVVFLSTLLLDFMSLLFILAIWGGNKISNFPTGAADIVGIIFIVSLLICSNWIKLAITAKRCHDIGISGWWTVLVVFFTFVIFVVLACIKGATGPNKYGENPLQTGG